MAKLSVPRSTLAFLWVEEDPRVDLRHLRRRGRRRRSGRAPRPHLPRRCSDWLWIAAAGARRRCSGRAGRFRFQAVQLLVGKPEVVRRHKEGKPNQTFIDRRAFDLGVEEQLGSHGLIDQCGGNGGAAVMGARSIK